MNEQNLPSSDDEEYSKQADQIKIRHEKEKAKLIQDKDDLLLKNSKLQIQFQEALKISENIEEIRLLMPDELLSLF